MLIGYIDGHFDESEKQFVREYIGKVVESRVDDGMPDATPEVRGELVAKFTTHFLEVFEGIDTHVKDLFTEAVSSEESQEGFVHAKLKLRCYEIFHGFDKESQSALLDTVDEFIYADGEAHPAEMKLRAEVAALL
ncbi:MAG: serine/threonine protein phosphatase, partial [Deltaproteobacteria bacterium]|nr:serine/threonine protein phosphatase [Deltaproteobacteria bacterium]